MTRRINARLDRKPAAQLADFVGCATGPRNLSADYKRALARSLARWKNHRPFKNLLNLNP